MKIAQASQLTDRGVGLLTYIMELCPIFRVAEYRLDASTHLHGKDSDTFTGTAARAEGDAAQKDAQVPSLMSKNLDLYTREITIDDVRVQDKRLGVGPKQLLEFADRRVKGLAMKLGEEVQDHMMIGKYSDNEMLGFSEFIKDAAAGGQTSRLGFTQAEIYSMLTQANLQLNTTENQDLFVELLIKELIKVPGANALFCNENLYARITTIARRYHSFSQTPDQFGIPQDMIWNRPIIPLPETAIPQTESDGANADCTSLYIVRFAEELGVCYSTNSGFLYKDFDSIETMPSGKARMSIYKSLTIEKKNAVRRISRLRL